MTNIKRTDIISWIILTVSYFATRLANLGVIPIFTDEAIYLRWSQIMKSDAALRYLPLVDGKPPLFMWLTSMVMKFLPNIDPLLTGRLVSVFAGFSCLIGIFFVSFILFKNKKIAYLSSIFYLLSPFAFFYDRLGLADSLLTMFGLWALGLGVLLVKRQRLDLAMILGITVGLGLLTKTPAQFFLYLLPVLLLLNSKNILKSLGLFLIVAVFSQAIFSVLRLFPLFNMIGQKNLEFIVPLSEFLKHPTALFWGNIKSLVSWQLFYLTPLVGLTTLFGVLTNLKKFPRQIIILTAYFLVPLVAMAAFNKVIYPRYLLPFTPVLLILAAVAVAQLKNKVALVLIPVLVLAYPVYTNWKLTTDPINAPLLQADRDQYIDGWAAGFGVKEVRHYLSILPGHQTVATEGTFGLMPYALELYQKDYPNVEIKSYWPLPAKPPAGTDFVIIYQHASAPRDWKVELVATYRQGKGSDFLQLYKVL